MKQMYVLVRKDLGTIYKMVQGAHALAQYALEHTQGFNEWHNDYLIFVEVENLEKLIAEGQRLTDKNLEISIFYEPDIEQHTAISCFADSSIFKKSKLAT